MLGKLLKHEWNATARRYGLFYLILASITLFTAIIHGIPVDNIFYTMGETSIIVLYILSLAGVLFCSTGMAIVRFYKNMVSDEGYLTFTLPAKVEQLVFAKFLVAYVWQLVTVVLCVLSLIAVFVVGHMSFGEFFDGVSYIADMLGGVGPAILVMTLISMMYQLMIYYLSIAIGQRFGNYKILASIIAYLALTFAVELVLMLIVLGIFGIVGIVEMSQSLYSMEGMSWFYLATGAISAVIGVAAYFVTCYQLKKKLNLV